MLERNTRNKKENLVTFHYLLLPLPLAYYRRMLFAFRTDDNMNMPTHLEHDVMLTTGFS
jgi:hypothetical protein